MQELKLTDGRRTQASIAHLTEQLYSDLRQSSFKHWLDERKVAQRLDERVQEWAYQAKNNLDMRHPYQAAAQQLESWLALEQLPPDAFQRMHEQYCAFIQQLGLPELSGFGQQAGRQAQQLQFQLLKEKWQRKLTEAVAHWEFEQLAQMRDAFLEDIKDFLAALQKMSKHRDSLGADTGIFIDYSSGRLTAQDVQRFEEWSQYLEQDQALQRLCRLIGSAQPSHYPRKAQRLKSLPDAELQTVQQASEEIAGIQLGQELAWALPNELALLADPELQILFDLKYLESNIMSFHLQGQQSGRMMDDPKQPHKNTGCQGPMIICLDTSGSMHGQPELISKAVCLYLAVQAMRQKRPLYLINFSTQLTALPLHHTHALDDLIHFLSQSFHGGTDIVPAMEHAVEMLDQPEYRQADIVVISDFIMGQLHETLMQKIEQHKQQGTGFYALAIGSFRLDHLDQGLFDHQWVYQSATGEIEELQRRTVQTEKR